MYLKIYEYKILFN